MINYYKYFRVTFLFSAGIVPNCKYAYYVDKHFRNTTEKSIVRLSIIIYLSGYLVSAEMVPNCKYACDMIKGNESLVENFDFNFLRPHSHKIKMLHFVANIITIVYLVTEL